MGSTEDRWIRLNEPDHSSAGILQLGQILVSPLDPESAVFRDGLPLQISNYCNIDEVPPSPGCGWWTRTFLPTGEYLRNTLLQPEIVQRWSHDRDGINLFIITGVRARRYRMEVVNATSDLTVDHPVPPPPAAIIAYKLNIIQGSGQDNMYYDIYSSPYTPVVENRRSRFSFKKKGSKISQSYPQSDLRKLFEYFRVHGMALMERESRDAPTGSHETSHSAATTQPTASNSRSDLEELGRSVASIGGDEASHSAATTQATTSNSLPHGPSPSIMGACASYGPSHHIHSNSVVFDSEELLSRYNRPREEEEADKWFSTHLRATQVYFRTMRRYPLDPQNMVKVAVIDTGFDLEHPLFSPYRENKQISQAFCYDAVNGKAPITDSTGHGTQCVSLLLKTAPTARIYVAKVFDSSVCAECCVSRIREAIYHAVDKWEVDIISMSFSFSEYYDQIRSAISHASDRHVLMFAAASNNRHNELDPEGYPAKMSPVIAVRSCNWQNDRSSFSPKGKDGLPNFSVIGEAVRTEYTRRLENGQTTDRMSGTSASTPIMAGIAALVLEYSRFVIMGDAPRAFCDLDRLSLKEGMVKVILDCMTSEKTLTGASCRVVKPWLLFNPWKPRDFTSASISVALLGL